MNTMTRFNTARPSALSRLSRNATAVIRNYIQYHRPGTHSQLPQTMDNQIVFFKSIAFDIPISTLHSNREKP
ncbi:hypothetical protein D9757_011342 [Collybiopsis confluens]|uniref:Uncharacterized protein n=1 Tax=Collybiopsis confluens TaxID=2823264 RepID=A0A8H5GGQ9_9AGAR|nr:hypothetical protein D9757_011342 [Collybiopsis confluens]